MMQDQKVRKAARRTYQKEQMTAARTKQNEDEEEDAGLSHKNDSLYTRMYVYYDVSYVSTLDPVPLVSSCHHSRGRVFKIDQPLNIRFLLGLGII